MAADVDQQIILDAEISIAASDFGHLSAMLDTTLDELREQGVAEGRVDAGQRRELHGESALASRGLARGTAKS